MCRETGLRVPDMKLLYPILSALLIVAGFVAPPMGSIDPSVLTAVGLLLGFKALDTIPELARHGTDITVKHGDASVSVSNPDPKQKTEQ